jgi:hypothetical protein
MASATMTGWGRTLFRVTLIGTVLQLLLVVAGHYDASIKALFAGLGMLVSLVAGLLFGLWSGPLARTGAIAGGAFAGAVCALIGIVESFYLKDVPGWVIAFGPVSSAVTGALGGFLGRIARAKT